MIIIIILLISCYYICRSYQSKHNILYSAQRNMIDGNLIWSYLQLSSKEKTDFAKQIGTSPGQVN